MNTRIALAAAALAACFNAAAQTAPATTPAPTRGALLYENHCQACHSTQMHWRDQRVATDWPTLRAQVTKWQRAAQLNWSADEIDEVTRHLNRSIYKFPEPAAPRVSLRWRLVL